MELTRKDLITRFLQRKQEESSSPSHLWSCCQKKTLILVKYILILDKIEYLK
jgi:hypothetical protein